MRWKENFFKSRINLGFQKLIGCFLAEEVQLADRALKKINSWHLALLLMSEQSSHFSVSELFQINSFLSNLTKSKNTATEEEA